jgi:transcriptional regulator with XRE-family HTH domain
MKHVSGVFHPQVLLIVHELRAYRLTMNISTREMARRANISTYPLARWEKEERMPDILNLDNWASSLGYKLNITIE